MEDLRIVQTIYKQVHRSLVYNNALLDMEDYLQEGHIGLLRAKQKHDPSIGPLLTFAYPYVKGAMLDHVRLLFGRDGRKRIYTDYADDVRVKFIEEFPDMKTPSAEQALQNAEFKERVRYLVLSLRKAYQEVLIRYYYQEKTMAQIGKELALTESRICQIHFAAVRELSKKIEEEGIKMPPKGWRKVPVGEAAYKRSSNEDEAGVAETGTPLKVDPPAPEVKQRRKRLQPKKEERVVDQEAPKQYVDLVVRIKIQIEVEHL